MSQLFALGGQSIGVSAFFIVQLSHAYMTTGKTIALTGQTFVGKVIFLLFNMLSRLGNRWGNSGNSVRLYFSGLQNHYRW